MGCSLCAIKLKNSGQPCPGEVPAVPPPATPAAILADHPAPGRERDLDGGYAWVILLIMFLLQSTISGSSRIYGLVYAKQVSIGYYDREQASWPIATASAVENLAGILTPVLTEYLSWRKIELLSTFMFILANFGAYLSQSLWLDILCLGVVQGVALSVSTVLSLAINNDYFERYRTSAYGISMSGSTFGVLCLSPVVSWLLDGEEQDDELGGDLDVNDDNTGHNFRLVYLALACAFCFNIILVLFIRPRRRKSNPDDGLISPRLGDDSIGQDRDGSSRSHKPPYSSGKRFCSTNGADNDVCHAGSKSAVANESARRESKISRYLERASSMASVSIECNNRRQSVWSRSSGHKMTLTKTQATKQRQISQHSYSPSEHGGASIASLGTGGHLGSQGGAGDFSAVIGKGQHPLSTNIWTIQGNEKGQPTCRPVGETTETISDHQASPEFSMKAVREILCSPYLHCVWIMLAIYYLISRVFIIILVDFAVDHKLESEQSRQLLNYWSVGELIGRILLGSVIDRHWLSVKNSVALVCSTLAAFIGLMLAIEGNYVIYALCSTLIAALVSLEYMLINVLMIEYVGKEQVTLCYSLASFLSSPVLFARPSLIGVFRDHWGSYEGLLLLLAAVPLAFGALFLLLEPVLVRHWPPAERRAKLSCDSDRSASRTCALTSPEDQCKGAG